MGVVGRLISAICFVSLLTMTSTEAQSFRCASGSTCHAIVGYVLPNTTTLSAIQTLFNVSNISSILGANNFVLSTPSTRIVQANQTIKIPFPCRCVDGTGMSDRTPIYKVVPDDGLDHIAVDVFSRLVTFQMIQKANNIPDANRINVGQELWIPLPCSCDDEDGRKVVHYGHVVARGSTVSGIAHQYNVSEQTLLTRNGLANPNDLMAGAVLDIPLPACTSVVGNDSIDNPLLVSNGTYILTANNCVMCKCDAANNWTLQCEPSQMRSSVWPSCPSMLCPGAENLYIGNVTSSSNCNRTTCEYAGYNNQTILKTLSSEFPCPVPNNSAIQFGLQGSGWSFFVSVYLVLLSLIF